MKKILTTLLICSCLWDAIAQIQPTNPAPSTKGNPLLSIGTGVNVPGKVTKENTGLDQGYGFNADLYLPLFTKSFSIGFNAGAGYFTGNKRFNNYTPFNITGQSSSPAISETASGSSRHSGFKAEGGAQANLTLGPITVSPILNAGYFSLKQKGFSATQTSAVNGKSNTYNLYSQEETKTTGFVFIPKLRFSYFPGKVGFYLEGAYSTGPTIKNEVTLFKPQGNPDAQGFYNIDQMLSGNSQTVTKSSAYNSLAFNLGVSLALGKNYTAKEVRKKTAEPQEKGHQDKEIKNIEQTDDAADPFAGLPMMKLEGRSGEQQECKPVIRYPRQGQRFGEKGPITFRVNIPADYSGEKSIRIYKISDDENYLSKLSSGERTSIGDRMSTIVNTLLEQTGKDKAIVKSLSKTGNEYSSNLDGLEKGSYMALIGNGNCHASPVSFIVGSGLHRLDVIIDTARCKGFNAAGKPVYTIAITLKNFSTAAENITYDFNNAANLSQNNSIPGNSIANIVYAGTNGTILLSAGTYPATLAPGVQQTFSIDYTPTNTNATCLNLDVYTSSLQGNATVNDNTFYCVPVIQCTCNYCDLIKWEFSKDKITATTQLTNNSISLSTTITAPAVNIKSFKAELISFTHVSVNGTEECFSCNKDSQTFGNFSSGTFTSAGWGALNGLFPVIPAGGGNTHHTLSWFSLSPPVTALSGSQIDLNISAPPFSTLACCDDVIRFCIRYSFTNADCQTCSFVKCYQITRKHK